jgi:putative NADH-flavin reductase
MKLLVLGATGATGTLFVADALAGGHQVTAYVRDPARVTTRDPNLTVVTGHADDSGALAAALPGHDAVISMLGNGYGRTGKTLINDSTRALIRAAEQSGVTRVVIMSAFGVGDSLPKGSMMGRFFYKRVIPGVLADKARGEAQLKSSGLDWTLAYPVTLNNKPATGFTATPLDSTPKLSGMPSISRADVAAFLLNTAVNSTYTRQTVTLRTAK